MWFFIRGIIGNAVCGGLSLYLGLPKLVVKMIGVALTDLQSIGLSLIIGGLVAWPIAYIWENGLVLPAFLDRRTKLTDAIKYAYTKLRHTDYIKYRDGVMTGDYADIKIPTIAQEIAQDCRTYGRKTHSTEHDEIPKDELTNFQGFINDGNDLAEVENEIDSIFNDNGDHVIRYHDLMVSKKDLKKFVRDVGGLKK